MCPVALSARTPEELRGAVIEMMTILNGERVTLPRDQLFELGIYTVELTLAYINMESGQHVNTPAWGLQLGEHGCLYVRR